MSLASCCVVRKEENWEASDAGTAAGLLSKCQAKHEELVTLVKEEQEMLLSLTFFMERLRFAETSMDESKEREVQFSHRVSEKEAVDTVEQPGLARPTTSRPLPPITSRPIPAPLYLSNSPPSPVKSRSKAQSSKGSGGRFQEVSQMYSINGLRDVPREMRNSLVDMVKSMHSMQSETRLGRYVAPFALAASRCFDAVWALQEPPRTGCLARVVKSQPFGLLSTLVILANAVTRQQRKSSPENLAYSSASQVFISFATDFEMANLNEMTPMQTRWVDLALSCFYVLEVSLKILVHRGFYFWNNDFGWNWRLSLKRPRSS